MAGRFDALTQLTKKPVAALLPQEQMTPPPNTQFASKEANQQRSLEAKNQTSKPTYQQGSKPVKKFSSYLTEDSLKAVKRIAFDTDRKDYEIFQDAVDQYLERNLK